MRFWQCAKLQRSDRCRPKKHGYHGSKMKTTEQFTAQCDSRPSCQQRHYQPVVTRQLADRAVPRFEVWTHANEITPPQSPQQSFHSRIVTALCVLLVWNPVFVDFLFCSYRNCTSPFIRREKVCFGRFFVRLCASTGTRARACWAGPSTVSGKTAR
jgi:hypothetical protein